MKISFWIILILIISSCWNSSSNSKKAIDTLPNNKILDTVSTDSFLKVLQNKTLTPKEISEVENILKSKEKEEEIKKVLGTNYVEGNELEVISNKTTYDSDFNTYLTITLKNNLKVDCIAFELFIIPTAKYEQACSNYKVKKKLKISALGSITFKEKIQKDLFKCEFIEVKASLGDCILSNGVRIGMSDFFHGVK